MNIMEERKDTREYLGRAYRIDRFIASKLEQIQSLRALAQKASITLSDMPGSPTRDVHKKENLVVRILDMQDEICREAAELLDIKHETIGLINRVENPEHRLLLEKRYLCYASWEDIAADLNCTVRHVLRLHGEALDAVRKLDNS